MLDIQHSTAPVATRLPMMYLVT